MSIEAMKQALEALEDVQDSYGNTSEWFKVRVDALRAAIEQAQANEFQPDWDAMAVMVAEQQRMATEIERLKDGFNKSESRLHDVAVHCERVERRLKDVNTAAMKLTRDLVCMDYDDDERLDRDRVMARIMQWRNEWDKAMFEERNT
jgi:chromosome segregation ATPase